MMGGHNDDTSLRSSRLTDYTDDNRNMRQPIQSHSEEKKSSDSMSVSTREREWRMRVYIYQAVLDVQWLCLRLTSFYICLLLLTLSVCLFPLLPLLLQMNCFIRLMAPPPPLPLPLPRTHCLITLSALDVG
jgi:hypothetical protein